MIFNYIKLIYRQLSSKKSTNFYFHSAIFCYLEIIRIQWFYKNIIKFNFSYLPKNFDDSESVPPLNIISQYFILIKLIFY